MHDLVTCLLCGKELQIVSFTHLRTHGTNRKEYMEEFGLTPDQTVSDIWRLGVSTRKDYRPLRYTDIGRKLRAIYKVHGNVGSGFVKKRWPQVLMQGAQMYGSWSKALESQGLETWHRKRLREWSPERVLKEIKALYKAKGTLSVSPKNSSKEERSLVWEATRFFGGWRKAVVAAGFDILDVGVTKEWSKERVLRIIKTAKKRDQIDPRIYRKFDKACRRYYGSIEQALEVVGISWEDFFGRERYTKEFILSELKRYRQKYGPNCARRILREYPNLKFNSRRHFGSWIEALEISGIKPTRKTWTKASLAVELKEVLKGKPTYAVYTQKKHSGLYAAAVKLYGDWETAVKAAGLKYVPARDREVWTEEKVISQLRELKQSGKLTTGNKLRYSDPKLFDATYRYLGSWASAVERLNEFNSKAI